jgi:hypothetical protein
LIVWAAASLALDPAPAQEADAILAARTDRGVAQAIEVASLAGAVTVVSGGASAPLGAAVLVRPSDVLRSDAGASFTLIGGARVHLGPGAEVSVAVSQTLLCPSITVRQGEGLLDLGPERRLLHVAGGPPDPARGRFMGVRLQEASGRIVVATEAESFRITPLSSPVAFSAPSGERRTIPAQQALVLTAARDAFEPAVTPEPARFPTAPIKEAKPEPRPAGSPKPDPAAVKVNLLPLCETLAGESYRYRINGRFLRDGAWLPPNVFVSTIGDYTAVHRIDRLEAAHLCYGQRGWDNPGTARLDPARERSLEAVRTAQAPHVQVMQCAAAVRTEPRLQTDTVDQRICWVATYVYDPSLIRKEVESLLEQAVRDSRMDRPETVHWDTLEGTVELAAPKSEGKLARAVDRRRVAYSNKGVAVAERRWFILDTTYEFMDHGRAAVLIPAEILKSLK